MKVVILGAGRRGIRLAKHLTEEKKNVIVIDEDPDAIARAMASADCLACLGNGTNIDGLEEIGIRNADAFIALTKSDETNLVSCSIASSEFNIPTTICALKNIFYTKKNNLMGITHVINPYQETAKLISRNIEKGIFSDIINFENSSLVLYNVYIDENSQYAGKLVKDIRMMIPTQFIIAALMRKDGTTAVPSGNTVIESGDTLSLAAKEDGVEFILNSIGKRRQKPEKIAIVGGSKIADFLINEFKQFKHKNVTLIDSRKEVCQDFASRYPDVLVINENITREGAFTRQGLGGYDLLIAHLDSDEQNILIASYAKSKGVKTAVSVIERNADYLRIADHLNIDSIISTQDASVDSILRYLHGTNIATLHSLFDGSLEAFEYKVTSKSKLCNRELKDIDMKGKGIITGIVRNKQTIIPTGKDVILDGDIIVMVTERQTSDSIQSLLAEN